MPLTLRSREKHPLYLAAAVPDGSVRAPSQVLYKAAARLAPELSGLRADALQTALAIADALADHADWDTMLSRPTHAELARAAGCSTRTVTRYRALLERAGLAGIVTPGRTSDPVDPDGGRLAQAYVLTIPRPLLALLQAAQAGPVLEDRGVATAEKPTGSGRRDDVAQAGAAGPVATPDPAPTSPDAGSPTPDRGPVDEHVHPSCPTVGGSGLGSTPAHAGASERSRCARGEQPENRPDQGSCDLARGPFWPTTAAPATREQRRLAAAEAWRIDPVLRRVSVAHVAALAREWHLAGWTIADLRHALVQRPDDHPEGPAWPHSLVAADVRHVPGWFRHRLTAWRTDPTDPTSPPAASPSQRRTRALAAAAAAHAAELAADRATRAAAVAAGDIDGWTAAKAAATARAAAARAAAVHARHQPPALPQDDAPAPADPAPRAVPPRAARRPAAESADPRFAALRAATRAGRRPRI